MSIGIYKITSPTKRVYVGQSINIEKRFNWYKGLFSKSQKKLHKSLLKYGVENHEFKILAICNRDELNVLEREYQELYKCLIDGLNCMLISNENAPSVRSAETKRKISEFQKTRVMSKETRNRISKSRTGLKFSKEHCENISKSKSGANNVVSIKVLNKETGVIYDTILQAAKENGLQGKHLSRMLKGTRTNKTNLIYAK